MSKPIITIAIIGAIAIIAIACTKMPPTTEVALLRDVTDSMLAKPVEADIFRLYGFEKNKWQGGGFRFRDISDVSYNRTDEASIEAENEWLSNEIQREKQIQKFKEQFSEMLNDSARENIGKSYSSVYLPIANELNRLSQSNAEKRILLVYSDLMENQKDLTFYDTATFNRLKRKPEIIRQFLEKEQSLSNLSGIEVHFIFQPKDNEADRKFRVVSEFYRKILENKGAKVFIGASPPTPLQRRGE